MIEIIDLEPEKIWLPVACKTTPYLFLKESVVLTHYGIGFGKERWPQQVAMSVEDFLYDNF